MQNYAPTARFGRLNNSFKSTRSESQEDFQEGLDDPMLRGANYTFIKQTKTINTEESEI